MSYKRIFDRAARILKAKLAAAAEAARSENDRDAGGTEDRKAGGSRPGHARGGKGAEGGTGASGSGRTDAPPGKQPGRMSEEECFRVLGVSRRAGIPEIKNAYRSLVAQYHPDKVAALGPELQELAAAKTREINEAYQTLRKLRGF